MRHANRLHGVQQADGIAHVVLEILHRLRHGLADIRVGGEVDHSGDIMPEEGARDQGRIGEIAVHKRPPPDGRLMARGGESYTTLCVRKVCRAGVHRNPVACMVSLLNSL
jgi:hypothetical protein